jgi:hypothetical protein
MSPSIPSPQLIPEGEETVFVLIPDVIYVTGAGCRRRRRLGTL